MPRWNNSLKDNIIQIMNNSIKNLNPLLQDQLLNELLVLNIENNKKKYRKFY